MRSPSRRPGVVCLLTLAAAIGLGSAAAPRAQPGARGPVVAAASDLTFAIREVAAAFARDGGVEPVFVFGSSGTLARQVRDGAPFELFLSADEAFVYELADVGLTRDRGVLYAEGHIAVFAPAGSPLHVDERLEGLRQLANRGGVTRFAIANPAHAPYGRAAEAVLKACGLWDVLQPSLVLGENVSQAAQFATTGNAVGGIVAYSLVKSPALAGKGTFALLPASHHPPLRQRMVLLKEASPAAEAFFAFVQSPAARHLLERFGFTVPAR